MASLSFPMGSQCFSACEVCLADHLFIVKTFILRRNKQQTLWTQMIYDQILNPIRKIVWRKNFVNPPPREIQMSQSWNSQNIIISRTNPCFSLFKVQNILFCTSKTLKTNCETQKTVWKERDNNFCFAFYQSRFLIFSYFFGTKTYWAFQSSLYLLATKMTQWNKECQLFKVFLTLCRLLYFLISCVLWFLHAKTPILSAY